MEPGLPSPRTLGRLGAPGKMGVGTPNLSRTSTCCPREVARRLHGLWSSAGASRAEPLNTKSSARLIAPHTNPHGGPHSPRAKIGCSERECAYVCVCARVYVHVCTYIYIYTAHRM